MSRFYTLSLFVVCAISINARIIGSVCDSIGEPVIGATISLFQQGDSLIVDAVSADEQGKFVFDSSSQDKTYEIKATCLGFKPYSATISDGESIKITLSENETMALAELVVSTRKPTVRRELGSFVISPNSYASLTNNSYDLLALMPLISRSSTGYSILGGGEATIYLNGRKPIMAQEQVQTYLRSVPPQNIKEIVVIQDSGVSQRGSIINVILDRPDEGFLGNATISEFAKQDLSTSGGIMAYYAKNRVALSAMVHGGGGSETTKSRTGIDFRNSGTHESRYYKIKNNYNAVNTDVQLQYSFNSKSYAGIFARVRNSFKSSRSTSENNTITPDGTEHMFNTGSKVYNSKHYMPTSVVATYHLDLDKRGSYLEAVADIDYWQLDKQKDWWGTDFDKYSQHFSNKSLSSGLRADIVKNFGNSRLDAGYSFLNAAEQDLTLDNEYAATDDYHFREILHKAYVNFTHKATDWLQYSIGARAEDIHQHIEQRVDAEYSRNRHFDIVPDISVSFFLPRAAQQIKIDYKIDLERPRYFQMNPHKEWSSESSYSQGNPYLKPNKVHIGSLFYIWNYSVFSQILYNYAPDYMNRVIRQASPGVTVSTYDNFGSFMLTQILLGYQKMFFNRWQISATTSAQYRNIDGGATLPEIKTVSWNWQMGLNNYVVISPRHKLNASVAFKISSPLRSLNYYYKWNNEITVRLEKQFGHNWNVSLSASNFLPRNRMTIQDTPELYYESRNLTRQAVLIVSASYTFGNNTVRKARTNQTSTVSERQ